MDDIGHPAPVALPPPDDSELASARTAPPAPLDVVLDAVLLVARLLAVVPALALVGAALSTFGYSVYLFGHAESEIQHDPLSVGTAVVDLVRAVDVVLVGVTLLLVAAGLCELLVVPRRDRAVTLRHLPGWLRIDDLSDLKDRIIAMVVLVLAVAFLEEVVQPQSDIAALELGGGIAAVILALTIFTRFGHRGDSR